MKIHRHVALAAATLITSHSIATQTLAADLIAYDMVGSTNLNLIEYLNAYTDAFSSSGDGAQKYDRDTSASIPFSVLDDSLITFPSDTLGIIDDNNLDEFFGVTDTVNSDNASGEISASWTFDILGEVDLAVSIDIGAMGDFESADSFVWTASIDGGAAQTIFTAVADESASLDYTLAGGAIVTLNDPMTIDGTVLNNLLQTFVAPVTGRGTALTITFNARTDGGSEGLAFQNLQILSNYDGSIIDPPEPELSFIHTIQGDGASTPMAGQDVIIEGIVVGDFQSNSETDNGNLSGFYVQEEDADADANPLTSEGIFVYDGDGAVDVAVGDKVRVTGEAKEYSGLTEIAADEVEVISSFETLPQITDISLPLSEDALEAFEGMYVNLPQALVISEYYDFDRYGEIVLAQPLNGESRPMTPTAVEIPGSAAYAFRAEQNLLSRITLDDGITSQNPDSNRHPNGAEFSLTNTFRGGDLVSDTVGILEYRYGLYRIQPTAGANYASVNPRSELPPYVGGDLTVATFNVLNYFTTIDEGDYICGPSATLECRGADDAEEFTRQNDKIVAALAGLNADIVGLIEIENSTTAVDSLVASLNAYLGDTVYAALNTGTIGTDAIKVGFIYKPAKTEPAGDFAVLDSSVDANFIDTKNRPALAQTFKVNKGFHNQAKFTAVINHFKSKGSDCDELGDPDLGDGQGNCNVTRTLAAQALADWLATDPTGSDDEDFLILGDLNAYDKEDPISALVNAGYTDLMSYFQGEYTHSYVFDGQFGYLDYALASTSLNAQITGTQAWNINADEPDILDYDTTYKSDNQIALYEANAFRSSDHDPILVGLSLTAPNKCEFYSPYSPYGRHHKKNFCSWTHHYWHWKSKLSHSWWHWGFQHGHAFFGSRRW